MVVSIEPAALVTDGANRRLALKSMPEPVLSSLRWPGRPDFAAGNLAWTYMIDAPTGRFALFVGQVEEAGRAFPFEVWVNGAEQPRGLGAVAKTLSMDMRANDRAWLAMKLDALANTVGDDAFEMRFPPHGEKVCRISPTVRFSLSVSVSPLTATPPGP
jgi:ribonucleoside-diphosphate reductase alpha chain